MSRAALVLASRYAQAFVDTFGDDLTHDHIMAIKAMPGFFSSHKQIVYFLSLPTLSLDAKRSIMRDFFKKHQLPESLNKLIELLIEHKRAVLLVDVFVSIVHWYQKKHRIVDVYIESSSDLDHNQLRIIQDFLAQQTGSVIIYTYHVNKALIAGIRVTSDTFVWEYSLQKMLRDAKQCIRQGKE